MSDSDTRSGLAELQGWMQGELLGGEAAGDAEAIDRRLTPSATLSSAERLAIYRRGIRLRLLETLRGMLPVFRTTVGAEVFDRFALDYLERHPPRSYTLARLADGFPAYLDTTRPKDGDPNDPRVRWSSFLVELATVERLLLEVYDGPGLEQRPSPDRNALMAIAFERFDVLRPVPAPCLRLLDLDFPVHHHLEIVRRRKQRTSGGEPLAIPYPEPTHLAICRREFRVVLHPLEPLQYALLEILDGHLTLDRAVRSVVGEGEPLSWGLVRRWLADWVEAGFFVSLEADGASTRPPAEPR